ncbi:MAG TPA: universal stress protein [Casimicrobiaceae bacterium]|nr:universal stress protein [Casimicrobiaceae bacterium]
MTYRSILVHVDDGPYNAQRLEVAGALAKQFPAQLVGAYLVPRGDYSPFATALIPPDLIEKRLERANDAQHAGERRFRDLAHGAPVEWRAPVGDPIEAGVIHSRYADLVVLGQPVRDQPDFAFSSELAHAVLMESGRPVLFVPYTRIEQPLGRRVLIAWKDARESARAVADALPFLKDAEQVRAVAITPDAEESLRDVLVDKQVEGFLARHGVKAQVKRIVASDVEAGELLLSHAADIGADMIVMGGYSRPRISQLVWGGVSRLILGSMTVPVLMSH